MWKTLPKRKAPRQILPQGISLLVVQILKIFLIHDAAKLLAASGAGQSFGVKLLVKADRLTAGGANDLEILLIAAIAIAAIAIAVVAIAVVAIAVAVTIIAVAITIAIVLNLLVQEILDSLQIVVKLLDIIVEIIQILVDLVNILLDCRNLCRQLSSV